MRFKKPKPPNDPASWANFGKYNPEYVKKIEEERRDRISKRRHCIVVILMVLTLVATVIGYFIH